MFYSDNRALVSQQKITYIDCMQAAIHAIKTGWSHSWFKQKIYFKSLYHALEETEGTAWDIVQAYCSSSWLAKVWLHTYIDEPHQRNKFDNVVHTPMLLLKNGLL